MRLTNDQALRLRSRGQGLVDQATRVEEAVRGVFAIQAQDSRAAALSIRARSAGLTVADVRQAVEQERSIVRAWCLRGTLHLVPAEDLRWLLALLGPVFSRSSQRRRASLRLDDDTAERGVRLVRGILASRGPLTRHEIAEQLDPHGIPTEGQAKIHLLHLATMMGIVCQGPDRGREPTYVLIDDWLGTRDSRAGDAAELARRYLAAFGPATPADFAAWSGLTTTAARTAWGEIGGELLQVEAFGGPAWLLRSTATGADDTSSDQPAIRLLAAFDTYLLGYRSRGPFLPAQHAPRVLHGGIIYPTLIVGDRIAGTWKVQWAARRLGVTIEPFDEMDGEVTTVLKREAEDVRRFLDPDLPPDVQLKFGRRG